MNGYEIAAIWLLAAGVAYLIAADRLRELRAVEDYNPTPAWADEDSPIYTELAERAAFGRDLARIRNLDETGSAS